MVVAMMMIPKVVMTVVGGADGDGGDARRSARSRGSNVYISRVISILVVHERTNVIFPVEFQTL